MKFNENTLPMRYGTYACIVTSMTLKMSSGFEGSALLAKSIAATCCASVTGQVDFVTEVFL
jgi:hypothetical protein